MGNKGRLEKVTYSVDSDKLLEEHDSNTNHCPPDDVRSEHVDPSKAFELGVSLETFSTLEFRVASNERFSVVNSLGSDGNPFGLYSGVGQW